jgi:hypothetical protein
LKFAFCSDLGLFAIAAGKQTLAQPWPHMNMKEETVRKAKVFGIPFGNIKRRHLADLSVLSAGKISVKSQFNSEIEF